MVSGQWKHGTRQHIGAFTCTWNMTMTTGVTYQTITQALFVFILLWTNCHIQAKRYVYSTTGNHVYVNIYVSESPCFCSYCLLTHFWGFYSDKHICVSVSLCPSHQAQCHVSVLEHSFVFSDPNQIYCSVLHFSGTQSQACSPSSEICTAELDELFFVKLYRVCVCGKTQTLGEISASQIRAGCRFVVPNLFINKATTVSKGRSWGMRFIHRHGFQFSVVILGHWCCCSMQSKTTSSLSWFTFR